MRGFCVKKQGHELEVARTIREADALWSESKYDLLVLDVSLPDGTGFAFCEKVRQVRHYVRLEALNWCKTAIPMGLALGMIVTWMLCAVLRFCVGEEFTDIPLFGISFLGIISGILVASYENWTGQNRDESWHGACTSGQKESDLTDGFFCT